VTTILPFTPKRSLLPPGLRGGLTYYELRNDALSFGGAPPRRGDICSVVIGEEALGEPNMVWTLSGQLLCGLLRYQGRLLVLDFPNPAFPTFIRDRAQAKVIGRVEQFFCAVMGSVSEGFSLVEKRSVVRPAEASPLVERPCLEDVALHLVADVPSSETIINWRADEGGHILFASDTWRRYLEPMDDPRTWAYIRRVHPRQRRQVAKAWVEAVTSKRVFDVTCEALFIGGYQLIRNIAVPVRSNGQVEWAGTLQLLGRVQATAS
jgi:hypothetical protein